MQPQAPVNLPGHRSPFRRIHVANIANHPRRISEPAEAFAIGLEVGVPGPGRDRVMERELRGDHGRDKNVEPLGRKHALKIRQGIVVGHRFTSLHRRRCAMAGGSRSTLFSVILPAQQNVTGGMLGI
jgi:hypothetical protein